MDWDHDAIRLPNGLDCGDWSRRDDGDECVPMPSEPVACFFGATRLGGVVNSTCPDDRLPREQSGSIRRGHPDPSLAKPANSNCTLLRAPGASMPLRLIFVVGGQQFGAEGRGRRLCAVPAGTEGGGTQSPNVALHLGAGRGEGGRSGGTLHGRRRRAGSKSRRNKSTSQELEQDSKAKVALGAGTRDRGGQSWRRSNNEKGRSNGSFYTAGATPQPIMGSWHSERTRIPPNIPPRLPCRRDNQP